MKTEVFNTAIEDQLQICKDILCKKANEYAREEDRLHNFKCAAGLLCCDPKEALCGMMVKHTVSVADMCRDEADHPLELWEEKITDSINYLLLLKALVIEDIYQDTDHLIKLGWVKYCENDINTTGTTQIRMEEIKNET